MQSAFIALPYHSQLRVNRSSLLSVPPPNRRKWSHPSPFLSRRVSFFMSTETDPAPPSISPDRVEEEITPAVPAEPTEDLSTSIADSEAVQNASATAQAVLEDLAARPEYYLNVSGVLLGIALSFIVLSATMLALDSIPLLPDALRIIGLAYLFWFLRKYLFSPVERSRLQEEIEEFVAGVRDPKSAVMDRDMRET